MLKSKNAGVIIDKSYFEPYVKMDNYGNVHSYKICKICLEPIDLGFSRDEKSGFAGTLPHICEKFKEFIPLLRKKGLYTSIDISKFIPELEWGEFVYKKNNLDGKGNK